ncbi:class I SAM-dependent methyltransferase [Rickettsiales bacterium LUAb2]
MYSKNNSKYYNKVPDQVTYYLKIVKNNMRFLWYYLHPKHHKNIGAIAPSSKFLANEIINNINSQQSPKKILEVGAGTGAFTKYIVKTMQAGDTLDIIEINNSFVNSLKQTYKNNPNITIYNKSILDFEVTEQYNYIISGLPFNYFPPKLVKLILCKYNELLANHGIISYFEYAFISNIKKINIYSKSRLITKVIDNFKKNFIVSKNVIYRNLPPAVVWHLKKKV